MSSLAKRVAELEAKALLDTENMALFVRFVAPDGNDHPIKKISVNGRMWTVEPGETDASLMERVVREDAASPLGNAGVRCYVCCS